MRRKKVRHYLLVLLQLPCLRYQSYALYLFPLTSTLSDARQTTKLLAAGVLTSSQEKMQNALQKIT